MDRSAVFDAVSARESERTSMLCALAVSVAAYATLGVVASNWRPLPAPPSAREIEIQLLPAASAAALGLTSPELPAFPAATRDAHASLVPHPLGTHAHERLLTAAVQPAAGEPQTQLVADAEPSAVVAANTDSAPGVDAESDADDSASIADPGRDGAVSRTGVVNGSAPAPLAVPPMTEAILPFGPGMTPPRRLSGEAPKYSAQALAARIEGKVIVRCVLGSAGDVRSCRIVKPLAELDRAAVRSLEASRFTPVTFQGRPTAVSYLFTFDFRLP